MLLLIILISGSILGWLYIICRLISRISEINDRMFRLVPSGFVLVLMSPLILVTLVWVNREYAVSLLYFDWHAFIHNYPTGSVLASVGWCWMLFEAIRRPVRRCIRSHKIKPFIRSLGIQKLPHREIFKNLPFPEKALYSIAGLLPGNYITAVEVRRYAVSIPEFPQDSKPVRLVHLTDVHYNGEAFHDYYERLVSYIKDLQPDIIIFTGDFFQHYKSNAHFKKVFSKLPENVPVYFVCGNHEYWDGIQPARDTYLSLGFTSLAGTVVKVEIRGRELYLAGTDFPWRRDTVRQQIDALPTGAVCIAASHDPDTAKWLKDKRIKLVLSGHTHGGQVSLPVFGPLVVPSKKGSSHAAGFVPYGNTLLYINYGAGLHMPVRLFCPLEIAGFDLCGARGDLG